MYVSSDEKDRALKKRERKRERNSFSLSPSLFHFLVGIYREIKVYYRLLANAVTRLSDADRMRVVIALSRFSTLSSFFFPRPTFLTRTSICSLSLSFSHSRNFFSRSDFVREVHTNEMHSHRTNYRFYFCNVFDRIFIFSLLSSFIFSFLVLFFIFLYR